MIDILIPTIGRPHRVAEVVANVAEATVLDRRLWFIVEAEDEPTIEACKAIGALWIINTRARNYSGAINTAYHRLDGDLLFAGADDVRFHPGWDVEAVRMLDGWAGVVGTSDLMNPYVEAGTHATHYLVARWYLDTIGGVVDEGPGSFLCEAYDHNYTDTEFIGTAKMRSRFRPCLTSIVEHLHWSNGKSPHDHTSHKAMAHVDADSRLYDERRDLWFNISR